MLRHFIEQHASVAVTPHEASPLLMPEAAVQQHFPGHTKAGLAFVLIDGVGDVGIQQLGFKTPLQQASVPFLDAVSGKFAFMLHLMSPSLPRQITASDAPAMSCCRCRAEWAAGPCRAWFGLWQRHCSPVHTRIQPAQVRTPTFDSQRLCWDLQTLLTCLTHLHSCLP